MTLEDQLHKSELQTAKYYQEQASKIKAALKDLLEGVMQCDLYRDREAGLNGDGPVVEAHRALGLELPPDLQAYLDDEEDPDPGAS